MGKVYEFELIDLKFHYLYMFFSFFDRQTLAIFFYLLIPVSICFLQIKFDFYNRDHLWVYIILTIGSIYFGVNKGEIFFNKVRASYSAKIVEFNFLEEQILIKQRGSILEKLELNKLKITNSFINDRYINIEFIYEDNCRNFELKLISEFDKQVIKDVMSLLSTIS